MTVAPITRRGLVAAGAAALGATALPAESRAAGAAEHARSAADVLPSDAELLALIEQHGPAQAACRALVREGNRLTSEYFAAMPAPPATVSWRSDDHFAVGWLREERPGGKLRLRYGPQNVDELRRLSPRRKPTWGPDGMDPVGAPDPDREARRLAIIAANDAWEAECQALADRMGVEQLEIRSDAAADALDDLTRRIVEMPAVTLAGLVAKAGWLIASDRIEEDGEALIREMAAFGEVPT